MTEENAAQPPSTRHLLTKKQVLDALAREISSSSLTEVARRYSLSPQSLCNVLSGRQGLSAMVLDRLHLTLREFYERKTT